MQGDDEERRSMFKMIQSKWGAPVSSGWPGTAYSRIVCCCHYLLCRFLQGDDEERRSMFKMIPRVAEGSWVIKQSVGTTPVIIGRKLGTSFHITPKYVEVAVDVGSSSTAQYITGMVSVRL
jgi:hypothetical protein